MRDVLGPGTMLGYCTNVHAGANLDATIRNLRQYASAVRRLVSPNDTMGIGLWLSAEALSAGDCVAPIKAATDELGLHVFTINGFPYGNFHEAIVKHKVYEPTWMTDTRLEYTCALADVLMQLQPDGVEGSISTLPIAWNAGVTNADREAAADRFIRLAEHLAASCPSVHVDIEPEPGCVLGTLMETATFFERHLLGRGCDDLIREHLRVCLDVCHLAVMFEDVGAVVTRLDDLGVRIGKVQVSSAPEINFDAVPDDSRTHAASAFEAFHEPRYLHQTTIRDRRGGLTFVEDLPLAMDLPAEGHWRTHFHVPIYAETLGPLGTTQAEIGRVLDRLRGRSSCRHFEVETYAWNVLPEDYQTEDLATGIAREMQWLIDTHGQGMRS